MVVPKHLYSKFFIHNILYFFFFCWLICLFVWYRTFCFSLKFLLSVTEVTTPKKTYRWPTATYKEVQFH